jgi:ferrous iron transport protein B
MAGEGSGASGACEACPLHLERSGIDLSRWDHMIALSGNPNTGKSTLFNAMTGLRQHVGNWPGKTVARAEGGFALGGRRFKVVDLPGTYSLLSASVEEEIARDFLLFDRPDAVIAVMDATAIERNLNLTLQTLEVTDRVVVALNLMDEARRRGFEVDPRGLSKELGVPVVPTVAKTGEGLGDLLRTVSDTIDGRVRSRPRRVALDPALEAAIGELVPGIEALFPDLENPRWVALRLLDGDPTVRSAIERGAF